MERPCWGRRGPYDCRAAPQTPPAFPDAADAPDSRDLQEKPRPEPRAEGRGRDGHDRLPAWLGLGSRRAHHPMMEPLRSTGLKGTGWNNEPWQQLCQRERKGGLL